MQLADVTLGQHAKISTLEVSDVHAGIRNACCVQALHVGVTCICKGSVTEAVGSTETGIRCAKIASSAAFFQTTTARLTVQKPVPASQSFFVVAEGEESLTMAISSESKFASVRAPTRSVKLSASKSVSTNEFVVTINSRCWDLCHNYLGHNYLSHNYMRP